MLSITHKHAAPIVGSTRGTGSAPVPPVAPPPSTKPIDAFLASEAAKDIAPELVQAALVGQTEAIPWIPQVNFASLSRLRGPALLEALTRAIGKPSIFGYDNSRAFIFRKLDVKAGHVTCVYGGKVICVRPGYREHMNVEHTMPAHRLKGIAGAKADLHNLFPTALDENNKRGSLPFGDVVDVEWQGDAGAKVGRDATGTQVFEPPQGHKGNVARAMLYMVAFYGVALTKRHENVMRRWNREDPVDADEMRRTLEIAKVQGIPNPFVLHPRLVDQALST